MRQAESPEDVETDHRPAEGSQVVVDLGHEPTIAATAIGRAGLIGAAPLPRRRSSTTSTEEFPENARLAYSKSLSRSRATTKICFAAWPWAPSRPVVSAGPLLGPR